MDEMFPNQIAGTEAIERRVLLALRRIIRSIDMHSRSLVKHYGLTGPQFVVLQEISKHEEIMPGKLAKAVSLSQATVTGILDRLENRDLIVRRRSETDRRSVLVSPTHEAFRLLNTGPPIMQVSFVEAFQRLEDWEQNQILSALQRLVTMMNADALDAAPILNSNAADAAPEDPPSV